MLCHTNEKKFCCGECGQRFKRKPQLISHEMKHTGILYKKIGSNNEYYLLFVIIVEVILSLYNFVCCIIIIISETRNNYLDYIILLSII